MLEYNILYNNIRSPIQYNKRNYKMKANVIDESKDSAYSSTNFGQFVYRFFVSNYCHAAFRNRFGIKLSRFYLFQSQK